MPNDNPSARGFTSIPVVDIGPMVRGEPDGAARVASELHDAARDVGFLYLVGHGIAQHRFDALRTAAKRFFALPMDAKMQVYIGRSANHRGYVPEGEEVFAGGSKDRKEAYDLAIDCPDGGGNPLLGPNQWPDLPGFADAVAPYYAEVFALGRLLMRGFALAMGEAAERFDAVITTPPSQLRLIHYPYDSGATDAVGIGAHTDYECFTLLHSTSPGLEVMNGCGEWIDAPPLPGAFIVNIGDMMEILTNGAFVATSHRVRKVKEERYSFPLFFSLDYDTRVEPLARFVTPGGAVYNGLVAGEHLFAQTANTFAYQKRRLAEGEIALPDLTVKLSSFGQQARNQT
jgi:isopenicillin N synthase-like dioxygenase